MRAVICKGDRNSHGGRVLEGNPKVTTGGRQVAQLGHSTVCPLCKGKYPIIEGVASHTYGGKPTAVHGMKTACGATLLASQHEFLIDAGGGGSGGGGGAHGGDIQAASAPSAPQAAPSGANYKGNFRAIDAASGEPIAGIPYRLELSDGRVLRGETDAEGHTQDVSHDSPLTMSLHWESKDERS